MSSRPQLLPSRLGHRGAIRSASDIAAGPFAAGLCRCNAVRIALQGSPYLLSYNQARACLADRLGGSEGFELAEGRCGNGCLGCPSSRIGPSRRPVVSNPTIGPRAGSRPVAAVGALGWRVVRSWPRSSCTFGSCTRRCGSSTQTSKGRGSDRQVDRGNDRGRSKARKRGSLPRPCVQRFRSPSYMILKYQTRVQIAPAAMCSRKLLR